MQLIWSLFCKIITRTCFLFCRLKEELKLVVAWENSALTAKENYGKTPITETIEDIVWLKELAIEDFEALYKAADDFNEWILKKA